MSEYQLQIERLVDGELSFAEETKLLQAIDDEPAGWKQLALAFLEDRTFCAALVANVGCSSSTASRSTPATQTVPMPHSPARFRNSTIVKICAACAVLLAAFLSGRFSGTRGGAANPDPVVADSNRPVPGKELATENDLPEAPEELPPPIEYVSLDIGPAGEEVQTVDVPLLPWEQVSGSVEAEQMEDPPSLITEDVREFLAGRGQTVREYIDYYEFELSDGRVGVVPVSNIEIQTATWPPIQ